MQDLIFRTTRPGTRVADPDNTITEFQAVITSTRGGYILETYTFGLLLTSKPFRTLAEARAEAQSVFYNVESVSV